MMPAMSEEQLKKNTDCVYFLASPLTCKKGNDCEFRHSEPARLNPRDCWFWFAGKCIKSNCTFRHPPLDGLSETAPTVRKHRAPCFYFGQGYCAKGEKCVFTHGLPPEVVKSTAVASETTMPRNLSKPANDVMECPQKSSKRIGIVDSGLPVESKEGEQITRTECEALKDDAKVSSSKTCLSTELQEDDKVTDASSRMPAAPARGGSHESVSGSNKSKQATNLFDGNPNQMYPGVEDISVKLPSEEVLQRVHSSENRVDDCNESEEKTSFDVLVDDARTDQVAHVEDTNVPMDQMRGSIRRGTLQGQDLVNYDYNHCYEQNSPYEFEAQNMYDPSAQHSYYNHMSTFDNVGSQTSCTFRGNIPTINEQRMALEKGTLSTEDLRHHIAKRRREERSLKLEEDYCQSHVHGSFLRSGLHHHHMHQYDAPSSYKERWIRGNNASDGQWRECPKTRQNFGYCHPEFKRGLDHMASEFGRANRECGFNKRLHHETHEYFRAKGKIYHRADPKAMNPAFHTGCKGFGQTKAEKIKGLRQHGYLNQIIDHQEQYLPKRSRISQTCNGIGDFEFPITPDFEGPKPLRILLEEKHRRFSSAEVEGRPRASRIESEEGFHSMTTPRNCESFRPDLEGPKPFLKEKHNGVAADCEVEGANTLRLENEVGFVSLNGDFQSLEKNVIRVQMDAAGVVLNRSSDLPMLPSTAKGNSLTSKAKSHCLTKMKDTNIDYPVDTELSLSLSCSREDHES